MVVCGPHIVDADNIAYLQQVTMKDDKYFVVTPKFGKSKYPLFLSLSDLLPLLEYWGLDPKTIKVVEARKTRRSDYVQPDRSDPNEPF